MNPIKENFPFAKKAKLSSALLIFLFTCIFSVCRAQPVSLGWKGSEIIPLSKFADKNNWNCGFQSGTGDSCYVTSDDSCLYLHWKFGSGNRYKYAQTFQVVSPSFSLANKHIIGLDVKGSACSNRRNVQIKFEDGINQAYHRWDGLASITRWCENISSLKKEFVNSELLRWDSVKVVSFEVNSPASDSDLISDSGVVAFRVLRADSLDSWTRANTFETITGSPSLNVIKKQAISAILQRQDENTGLFYTWLTDKFSYLYGQGLVLKILSMEGKWDNTIPLDSCSEAAEKLALFLASHQDKLGYWPRVWNAQTGDTIKKLEDNGTIWMGDFPWMITGLQNYYNKSGDKRVKNALEKARTFLYSLIDSDGKFYTLKPATGDKIEVTSSEAYAAAILSVYEMGDTAKAETMLQYIDSKTWDPELKYWQEAIGAPRTVLFANTWLSPFFRNSADAQKSLNALTFAGKALFTRGPGEPYGFDGIGPVATWFEGTLSYICAGSPGSDSLFNNLINYRYPDGSVPHYNDEVSVAGIWAVPWSSLDGTSWLYFAASRKSPFERGTVLKKDDDEPKKVFIHTLGWYGEGSGGEHWKEGYAHTPLIGFYNSQSWALQLYQILLSYSCGIDGMIMNQKNEYDMQSVSGMLSTIDRIRNIDSLNFKYDFAISYDDQGMDLAKPFDIATTNFNILKNDILPNTDNYLYYYDKPAAFVFNYPDTFLAAHDYDTVLNEVFVSDAPLLIWNQIEDTSVNYIDASYPWVGPDDKGWDDEGKNWGKEYLKWYYQEVNLNRLNLYFAIGGVWPGFDGRQCSWDGERWMDRQNGAVYDSTWMFVNDYNLPLPLKWVLIETWNDWNEGTEIEPSVEYGYQYLKATIKNINTFKGIDISEDTCIFEAAKKIYLAADSIEKGLSDSASCYPILECAIKYFLAGDCNGVTLTLDRVNSCTSDINVTSSSERITVFPNPSTGQIEVSCDLLTDSSCKTEVYNSAGLLVQQLSKNTKDNKISIDITDYPAGIYLIRITENKKTYFSRIIKK